MCRDASERLASTESRADYWQGKHRKLLGEQQATQAQCQALEARLDATRREAQDLAAKKLELQVANTELANENKMLTAEIEQLDRKLAAAKKHQVAAVQAADGHKECVREELNR